jgi:hypothetical protein
VKHDKLANESDFCIKIWPDLVAFESGSTGVWSLGQDMVQKSKLQIIPHISQGSISKNSYTCKFVVKSSDPNSQSNFRTKEKANFIKHIEFLSNFTNSLPANYYEFLGYACKVIEKLTILRCFPNFALRDHKFIRRKIL